MSHIDLDNEFTFISLARPVTYSEVVDVNQEENTAIYNTFTLTDYMFSHKCGNNEFAAYPQGYFRYECCNCHKVLKITHKQLQRYRGIAAII